jgi:hypothetical protein
VPDGELRLRGLKLSDFDTASTIVLPSVSQETVQNYEAWIQKNEMRPQRNAEEASGPQTPVSKSSTSNLSSEWGNSPTSTSSSNNTQSRGSQAFLSQTPTTRKQNYIPRRQQLPLQGQSRRSISTASFTQQQFPENSQYKSKPHTATAPVSQNQDTRSVNFQKSHAQPVPDARYLTRPNFYRGPLRNPNQSYDKRFPW